MFGCLNKSESVTVTDIAPVRGAGMKVTGWAVRPPTRAGRHQIRLLLSAGRSGWRGPPSWRDLLSPPAGCCTPRAASKGKVSRARSRSKKTTSGEAGASGWGRRLHLGRSDQEAWLPDHPRALQRKKFGRREGMHGVEGLTGRRAHLPADMDGIAFRSCRCPRAVFPMSVRVTLAGCASWAGTRSFLWVFPASARPLWPSNCNWPFRDPFLHVGIDHFFSMFPYEWRDHPHANPHPAYGSITPRIPTGRHARRSTTGRRANDFSRACAQR